MNYLSYLTSVPSQIAAVPLSLTVTTRLPAEEPTALRERWRAESLDSVWLRPGDWYHPAVDLLAQAVASGAPALDEAENLGRARADAGVGIGEAIDDLTCLYRTVGASTPPVDVVRALSVGWADAQAGETMDTGVLDPETGLPTSGYLRQRLVELYGVALRRRIEARTTHALIVVDVAVEEVPRLLRAARSAAVGAALRAVFGAGHPMATLGGGVASVLVSRAAAPERHSERLRAAIERRVAPLEISEATRCPVRIWQVLLPDTPEEAATMLHRLARPTG